MAVQNRQIFNDVLAPDALPVDEQPCAAPEKESIIPMQIEPPERNTLSRRSTRNLFPKYTKKMKLHRGLPTSHDDDDILRT